MKSYRCAWPILKETIARLASSRRGAAAVEFALLAPVIAVVVISIADYGTATYAKMELVSAARAGAQHAIRDRTDTSGIQQTVVDSTNLSITTSDVTASETCLCLDVSNVSSSATCGASCSGGDPTQYYMTVTASDSDYTLFLSGLTWPLSGSVKVRTK